MRWVLIGLLFLGCAAPTGNDDGPAPGMAYLTITNGLPGYDIVEICWRLVDDPQYPDYIESFWRWSWGYRDGGPLEPGESVSFEVEPDLYDIQCVGKLGSTYTRYDVEITLDGYAWRVTPPPDEDDEDDPY